MRGDKVIHAIRKGKSIRMQDPARPDKRNFLITCQFGDWSGFRSLQECLDQVEELKAMSDAGNREYEIVERF